MIDPGLRLLVERGHVEEFQPPFILFLVPAGFLVLLAACQALLLSATGMICGGVIGFVPGLAVALLDQPSGAVPPGPQVAVPWQGLVLLIITVPLISAGLAACTTRNPVLSRRPT